MPYLSRLGPTTTAAQFDIKRRSTATTASDLITRATTSFLSNTAIILIAVAGATVFFVCLALLLIRIAKWQDRRRGPVTAVCPTTGVSYIVGVEPDASVSEVGRSKKLRKKSFASEHRSADGDTEHKGGSRGTSVETGDREDGRLGIPPPVLPPVLSRPGSFTFGLFGGEGANTEDRRDGDGDVNTRSSAETQRQKKYNNKNARKRLQDRHRTPSWIDEDALHGPLMGPSSSSPSRKNKGNRKDSSSRLLSLGRSLSRKISWRREEVTEIIDRSPTLPHTKMDLDLELEQQQESLESEISMRRVRDKRLAAAQERLAGVLERDANVVVAAVSPRQPQPEEYVPQPSGSGISRHGSHSGFIVGMPSDSVHNPKQRNSAAEAALEATEQLAGSARIPTSSVPQPQLQLQTQASPQRPQHPVRAIKSATDVELAGILRSTAKRLQDRRPSGSLRRQTMASQGMGAGIRFTEISTTTIDRDSILNAPTARVRGSVFDVSAESSPAKSPKSAPAIMPSYAELEGCSPNPQTSSSYFPAFHSAQPQSRPQTLGHRRQTSHTSFPSMISDPDSLMMASPSRRGSSQHHEVQQQISPTTLPSPSHRLERESCTFSDRQQERPYSATSCESSALSTLYSEDEMHMQGQGQTQQSPPPISELRLSARATAATTTTTGTPTRISTTDTPERRHAQGTKQQQTTAYSSPYHNIFDKTYRAERKQQQQNNRNSARFAFEDGDNSPRPWRARRGTVAGPSYFSQQQQQQQEAHPKAMASSSSQGRVESARQQQSMSLPPPPRPSLQSTIYHAHERKEDNNNDDEDDDPFLTTASTSAPPRTPSPRRRLLPPLPVELAANEVVELDRSPNRNGSPSERRLLPLVHVTATTPIAELPTPDLTQEGNQGLVVLLPPQALRPVVSSPTLGALLLDVERRSGGGGGGGGGRGGASPVVSEAGLSSVYDSYDYNYAETTTQVVAQVDSNVAEDMVVVVVPRTTAGDSGSPIRDTAIAAAAAVVRSDKENGKDSPRATGSNSNSSGSSPFVSSPSGRGSRVGFRASRQEEEEDNDAQYCIDSKKSTTVNDNKYSLFSTPTRTTTTTERKTELRYLQRASPSPSPSPRSSSSQLQQQDDDDEDDVLPPLPLAPLTPTKNNNNNNNNNGASSSSSNNLRVANSIAELRRMNSQLSSASGHSGYSSASANNSSSSSGGGGGGGTNTDTDPGSPTLPALRGGGCSPGSRNRDSGRNYLSLGGGGGDGGSPTTSTSGDGVVDGVSGRRSTGNSPARKGRSGGGGGDGNSGGLQRRSAPVGGGRSRRGTMVGLSSSSGGGGGGGGSPRGSERMRNSVGVLMGDVNMGNVGVGAGVGAEWARQRQRQRQRQQGHGQGQDQGQDQEQPKQLGTTARATVTKDI